MKIGFIGLGIMGSRMAHHLLRQGHTLTIYNRTASKAMPLIEQGAQWATTSAAVALESEVLITMLAHPAAVKETALGKDGFLTALAPQTLWIDCSTVHPAFSREMAQTAQEHQILLLDAPVAGSKTQAANAELVFYVGGDQALMERYQQLFAAMGRKTVYVGEQGMGTAFKMVLNMLLAVSMTAFAEALVFGQALGLTSETLFSLLNSSPVIAPAATGKQPKINSGDYTADFPLQWMHKDLHLAALTAYDTQPPLLLATLTKELYQAALKQGYGDQDFAAIYAYLQNP